MVQEEITKVFNLKTSYALKSRGFETHRFVELLIAASNKKVFKLKTFLIEFEHQHGDEVEATDKIYLEDNDKCIIFALIIRSYKHFNIQYNGKDFIIVS